MDTAAANLNRGESLETAIEFLTALLDEQDLVLFRPIESWTEFGRKQSRVDHKNTFYRRATPSLLGHTIEHLLAASADNHTNLFFGVCPRLGPKGRFDLAWQIRTVRALWSDIDGATVEEALTRCEKAGLPEPSIVVNSGNGAHLYWLLAEPYLIDDTGPPPPVETEWIEQPDGRRKPIRYVSEGGEKIRLDGKQHLARLSPKAQHIQDVLSGIAASIGGDHTTDLSRLLRLPGTLNRKGQRIGAAPKPTRLLRCETDFRYSLAEFERLASESPSRERARQVASMPLPTVRKPSAAKCDELSERIATCSIAKVGDRSEADFALCCYAIRQGISAEEVWGRVESVGKFAESGRRYFDLTWENAAYDVRVTLHDKLEAKLEQKPAAHAQTPNDSNPSDDSDSSTIFVSPATTPVAHTMRRITDVLLETKRCYSRAEQLVVVKDDVATPVLSAAELAGLLNSRVEFYFEEEGSGSFRPLPQNYGNTWLNQPNERSRLPKIKLFTHNPVYTEDWRVVAPGYDEVSGIYYAGPAVQPRSGTKHLDALLEDFCFKRPADRTNYLGVLLTAILIPRFIGSKPAVMFNGNQPELGKSILAQIIAILRDGHPVETISYNPNDEEFEKRIGAAVRRSLTTLIIDNAKGRGRNPRIESACLERSITDPILSYRLLGQSREIRAENSHIFCVTANTPDVSRDLVTRSVVVNLYFEGDPERRQFTIADPEGYAELHRLELLGELIGMVERWKAGGCPKANAHSRFNKRDWGRIVGGILDHAGEPDFLANAEEASAELDETRREFGDLVTVMADRAQGFWTAGELGQLARGHGLLSADFGEASGKALATRMGLLAARYIGERFHVTDERIATFQRSVDRKGNIYLVRIEESAGR